MSQKLSAQKAALYYGCDVKMWDERNPELGIQYGKMIELSDTKIAIDTGNYIGEAMPHECQLALTPLEKVSDEHKKLVAYTCNYSIFKRKEEFGCDWENMITIGREVIIDIRDEVPLQLPTPACVLREIFDILRSLHYDVDNAINDGWAIDKTELI